MKFFSRKINPLKRLYPWKASARRSLDIFQEVAVKKLQAIYIYIHTYTHTPHLVHTYIYIFYRHTPRYSVYTYIQYTYYPIFVTPGGNPPEIIDDPVAPKKTREDDEPKIASRQSPGCLQVIVQDNEAENVTDVAWICFV